MTEQLQETFNPGILDLSGADTSAASFDPIDAGRYEMEVWEGEWTQTKEDSQGALGGNFPYINIQVRITENNEKWINRRLFPKFYPLAPEGYDATKKARNQGAFVNFLVALGFKEEEVKSPAFKLDFDEMKGKPFIGIVSKDAIKGTDPVEYENRIKGFKPLGDTTVDSPGVGNAANLL